MQVRVKDVVGYDFLRSLLFVKQVDILIPLPADSAPLPDVLSIRDHADFSWLIARDQPLSVLLEYEFLTKNGVLALPELGEEPEVFAHRQNARSHSAPYRYDSSNLGVVTCRSALDRGNSAVLAPGSRSLRLSVDRETYHRLGLTHSKNHSGFHRQKSAEQGQYFAIDIPLTRRPFRPQRVRGVEAPLKPDRVLWALDPARLGVVDLALTRGKDPVNFSSSDKCSTHHLETSCCSHVLPNIPDIEQIPPLWYGANSARYYDRYHDIIEWISTLCLYPTRSPDVVPAPHISGPFQLHWERYRGFSTNALASSALRASRIVRRSRGVPYTIIVAQGYADAPLLFPKTKDRTPACPSFGGDVVLILVDMVERTTGFEVLARQDL